MNKSTLTTQNQAEHHQEIIDKLHQKQGLKTLFGLCFGPLVALGFVFLLLLAGQ
jgi:hypothetical protein